MMFDPECLQICDETVRLTQLSTDAKLYINDYK